MKRLHFIGNLLHGMDNRHVPDIWLLSGYSASWPVFLFSFCIAIPSLLLWLSGQRTGYRHNPTTAH